MEAHMKVQRVLMFELTENEAEWLKGFIQNFPGDPSNEDPGHQAMRLELFSFLRGFLESK